MNTRGPWCIDIRPTRGERRNMTIVTGNVASPARNAE
jgi:hypothetical protein